MTDKERKLRSTAWFGGTGKNAFMHRSWMKNQGYPDDMFDGRPVIGICNTWSELTPCNGHFRELAEFYCAFVESRPDRHHQHCGRVQRLGPA